MDKHGLERALRSGLALADAIVQNATKEDLYTLAGHAHRQLTPFLAELSDEPSGNVKFGGVYDQRRAEMAAQATRDAANPESEVHGVPPPLEGIPSATGVGSAVESAPLPPSRGEGAAISDASQATKALDEASKRAAVHRAKQMGPATQPGAEPGADPSDVRRPHRKTVQPR